MSEHDPWKKLTAEEERVIVNGGTEAPFSGRFVHHAEAGNFYCGRCSAPLYESSSKFDSGCGWPSFDDTVAGAVREFPDADGSRVEIRCARCDGHLGHVFRGEGFTEKNSRHCVNSVSISFRKELREQAFFAGGCFWGIEHLLQLEAGVERAESGYMGGETESPRYEDICRGGTGHAEVVRVTFDPAVVTFETLAKLFFEIHDPTQLDRQGPDVGTQYRSAVFYANPAQQEISAQLISTLEAQGLCIATEVAPAGIFWPAEDYHQDYFERRGVDAACHLRVKRF